MSRVIEIKCTKEVGTVAAHTPTSEQFLTDVQRREYVGFFFMIVWGGEEEECTL